MSGSGAPRKCLSHTLHACFIHAAPPAWENSLWTALFLLNDFFELRFSTFVLYLTLQHTPRTRTVRQRT
ncbi:hypothetical protein C9I56_22525 [Paraburkholderia caribensis]|nr:hypothetical protein AN416_09385 [Paraburkholderia caribensis]AMV42826.1 hypothetical protein ATN79_09075 [Paraburkholderia caribensis]AUT51983.1 hypothetical protein C2L66_09015 [Paraburkholderia caribensis]PTB26525.1 hypothetical protein C9I56_22525 [Paraburkholderia caribensis]CAG9193920.1 conserved hypothetical protein [Paraburkholderia caribensis]